MHLLNKISKSINKITHKKLTRNLCIVLIVCVLSVTLMGSVNIKEEFTSKIENFINFEGSEQETFENIKEAFENAVDDGIDASNIVTLLLLYSYDNEAKEKTHSILSTYWPELNKDKVETTQEQDITEEFSNGNIVDESTVIKCLNNISDYINFKLKEKIIQNSNNDNKVKIDINVDTEN